MRIAIVGGAGFIGSSLALRLAQDKQNAVLIVDNMFRNALEGLTLSPNISVVRCDACNYAHLHSVIYSFQPDIIINTAALTGIYVVTSMPLDTLLNNITITKNVLSLLADTASIRKVLLLTSGEALGENQYDVVDNKVVSFLANDNRSSYGISKFVSEYLCFLFSQKATVPIIVVRPFNVFGERQVGDNVIHKFVKQALTGEPITIYGTGKQSRCWCYIDDFVEGFMILLEKALQYDTYNIGNSRNEVSVQSVALEIYERLHMEPSLVYATFPFNDPMLRKPDISKIQKLGFEPKVMFEVGLQKIIDYYQRRGI